MTFGVVGDAAFRTNNSASTGVGTSGGVPSTVTAEDGMLPHSQVTTSMIPVVLNSLRPPICCCLTSPCVWLDCETIVYVSLTAATLTAAILVLVLVPNNLHNEDSRRSLVKRTCTFSSFSSH